MKTLLVYVLVAAGLLAAAGCQTAPQHTAAPDHATSVASGQGFIADALVTVFDAAGKYVTKQQYHVSAQPPSIRITAQEPQGLSGRKEQARVLWMVGEQRLEPIPGLLAAAEPQERLDKAQTGTLTLRKGLKAAFEVGQRRLELRSILRGLAQQQAQGRLASRAEPLRPSELAHGVCAEAQVGKRQAKLLGELITGRVRLHGLPKELDPFGYSPLLDPKTRLRHQGQSLLLVALRR